MDEIKSDLTLVPGDAADHTAPVDPELAVRKKVVIVHTTRTFYKTSYYTVDPNGINFTSGEKKIFVSWAQLIDIEEEL
jgi:hypothetical protein